VIRIRMTAGDRTAEIVAEGEFTVSEGSDALVTSRDVALALWAALDAPKAAEPTTTVEAAGMGFSAELSPHLPDMTPQPAGTAREWRQPDEDWAERLRFRTLALYGTPGDARHLSLIEPLTANPIHCATTWAIRDGVDLPRGALTGPPSDTVRA
jgi:hypothetical protein